MGEFEVAASMVYYLVIILGSITSGYLAVRYAYPDVRTFNREEKLGASVLLGVFIAVLAVLADIVYSGLFPVFSAKGIWPVFWLASSLVAFLILFVGLRKPNSAEVAVPATKRLALLQKELESLEQTPPADPELKNRLDDLRQRGVIPKDATLPFATQKAVYESASSGTPPALVVSQNVREAKRVLEKARELEVETILSDLQLDYPQTVFVPESSRHRRLYLASRQTPSSDEEKQIVQDVYLSFHEAAEANKKKDERKGKKTPDLLKDETKATSTASAGQKAAAPTGSDAVSMADLFGESSSKPKTSPKSVFAQLEKTVTSVPVAQPPACPTCKQKSSRIVFCPYCGAGMCANCSPKVVPGPDGFTYTCPKCQEDIPVKKKQAPPL